MKKVALAVLALVLISSSAFALSIRNSKHDLSVSGGQTIQGSTQHLCEHCHAPHNAFVSVPLWNRAAPTGTFRLYTGSATLKQGGAAHGASISATGISGQCLSCHAATTAAGDVLAVVKGNSKNASILASPWTVTREMSAGAAIGTDLTNDHPIGFSYDTAINDRTNLPGATPLQTAAYAEGKNVKFYGTGRQMECSSCHMVHDNANGKFVRIPNTGSALCRACHQN